MAAPARRGGPEFARSVYLSANRPEAVRDMSCWCVVGISGRNPVQTGGGESVDPELIEANSYRILRSRIDLSHLPPFTRAVTERMIYVSADFGYATDLVSNEGTLAAAVAALAAGAPVVADVATVAAAITARPALCRIDDPLTRRLARVTGLPLAAAAVRRALGDVGPGAIWVVGAASAALEEIIQRGAAPALVIGMPAGFVGAAEAKQALRASGLPSLTNMSEKGGAEVAAAAADALLRAAADQADAGPAPAGPSAAQTS
jgi:precorrin-8X/cobalt-precorrin-8 methylmutase